MMFMRRIKPDGDRAPSVWNELSVRVEHISKEVQQLKKILNK